MDNEPLTVMDCSAGCCKSYLGAGLRQIYSRGLEVKFFNPSKLLNSDDLKKLLSSDGLKPIRNDDDE